MVLLDEVIVRNGDYTVMVMDIIMDEPTTTATNCKMT